MTSRIYFHELSKIVHSPIDLYKKNKDFIWAQQRSFTRDKYK